METVTLKTHLTILRKTKIKWLEILDQSRSKEQQLLPTICILNKAISRLYRFSMTLILDFCHVHTYSGFVYSELWNSLYTLTPSLFTNIPAQVLCWMLHRADLKLEHYTILFFFHSFRDSRRHLGQSLLLPSHDYRLVKRWVEESELDPPVTIVCIWWLQVFIAYIHLDLLAIRAVHLTTKIMEKKTWCITNSFFMPHKILQNHLPDSQI